MSSALLDVGVQALFDGFALTFTLLFVVAILAGFVRFVRTFIG